MFKCFRLAPRSSDRRVMMYVRRRLWLHHVEGLVDNHALQRVLRVRSLRAFADVHSSICAHVVND